MNVSNSTSIASQYASATATAAQKVPHNHAHRGGEKTGDSVELSAEAKAKFEQSKGDLSSDWSLLHRNDPAYLSSH